MEYLAQHIESLIFTTEHPITAEEIQSCLEETFETPFEPELLTETLEALKEKYKEEAFAFELVEIANGFQFLTKGAYHQTVGTYLKQTTKRRLSKAAIETLSMIAYKQPVSKTELEKIRGVSCDYSIQKLLEKELVTILGRADTPGRPLLYGTTEKFMDYFGIKSLKELPKPKDFKNPDSEVGEPAPIDEEVKNEALEPGVANAELVEGEEQLPVEGEQPPVEGEASLEETKSSEEEESSTEEEQTPEEEKEEESVESQDAVEEEQPSVDAEEELEKKEGISNTDVSIEVLDGAFDQEE